MIIKRIAALSFGIAFLLAILLFSGNADRYLGTRLSVLLFLLFGAVGMVLNLVSYSNGKQDSAFNLFYWIGTILLFGGFLFRFMHWPYDEFLIIAGLVVVGLSYFLPKGLLDKKENDEDLLDN